jgi:hypothetical protein
MPRRILIYEGIPEESLHVCTHVDVWTVFKGVYIYFWLFNQRVELETGSEADLVSCLSCANLDTIWADRAFEFVLAFEAY